jgi:hypothetical protein
VDSVVQDYVSSTNAVDTSIASIPLPAALSISGSIKTPTRKRKSGKGKHKDSQQEEPPTTVENSTKSSKFVRKFMGMFTSSTGLDVGADSENEDGGGGGGGGKRSKPEAASILETLDPKMKFDHRSEKEREVRVPSLYVFDYGRPRYGLSHASWTLLVLARCAIEDVVLRLSKIDPTIVLTKPKIKVDDKLMRDMSKSIGVSGRIAEGDSEDEYSVSQLDHADSEASVDLGVVEHSSTMSPAPPSAAAEDAKQPAEGRGSFTGSLLFSGRRWSKPGSGLQIVVPNDENVRNQPAALGPPVRTNSPIVAGQK